MATPHLPDTYNACMATPHLPDGVVDLVGPSVGQLLALEPDLGPLALLAEPLGMIEGRGATNEIAPISRQLSLEGGRGWDTGGSRERKP